MVIVGAGTTLFIASSVAIAYFDNLWDLFLNEAQPVFLVYFAFAFSITAQLMFYKKDPDMKVKVLQKARSLLRLPTSNHNRVGVIG